MTDYEIIDRIIEREGGDRFTDRPSDRGGPTKFGITQRAWHDYRLRNRDTLAEAPPHVRDITLADARTFYWTEHVSPYRWIEDDTLRELVVDSSVNHGLRRATIWLQLAAEVAGDGVIGAKTRAAVNTKSGAVYGALLKRRFRFYAHIATDELPLDRDLPNLRGWINRACEFIR